MADSYVELSFVVAGERVPELVERLQGIAPGGIVLEEPYVALGPDEGVRLEAGRPTVIKLYLPADERLAERRAALSAELQLLSFVPEVHERLLRNEDWEQSWKQFFQVEHVGRRLVVRPSWRPYTAEPGEIVITLDPGMAFGTGQHPTTRLCLTSLDAHLRPGMAVLDLGSGSGILSVAAAKLGARSVLALDVETAAVAATCANAELNAVTALVRAEFGSLGDAWPLPSQARHVADLIVANINAATLVGLATELVAALRPGGTFIGSGIIAERLDEPLLALTVAGLRVERLLADGDWRALLGTRQSSSRD